MHAYGCALSNYYCSLELKICCSFGSDLIVAPNLKLFWWCDPSKESLNAKLVARYTSTALYLTHTIIQDFSWIQNLK
jgi:hypothetical protein